MGKIKNVVLDAVKINRCTLLAESEILQTLALRQFPCRGVGAQHEFQMHLAIVLS